MVVNNNKKQKMLNNKIIILPFLNLKKAEKWLK